MDVRGGNGQQVPWQHASQVVGDLIGGFTATDNLLVELLVASLMWVCGGALIPWLPSDQWPGWWDRSPQTISQWCCCLPLDVRVWLVDFDSDRDLGKGMEKLQFFFKKMKNNSYEGITIILGLRYCKIVMWRYLKINTKNTWFKDINSSKHMVQNVNSSSKSDL